MQMAAQRPWVRRPQGRPSKGRQGRLTPRLPRVPRNGRFRVFGRPSPSGKPCARPGRVTWGKEMERGKLRDRNPAFPAFTVRSGDRRPRMRPLRRIRGHPLLRLLGAPILLHHTCHASAPGVSGDTLVGQPEGGPYRSVSSSSVDPLSRPSGPWRPDGYPPQQRKGSAGAVRASGA